MLGNLPGPAPKLIGKALTAGFSLQIISQTAQESPKLIDALARGDENEAQYELTKMMLGLAMGEQGIEHLGTNEETGEKAFNPNLGTTAGTSIDALTHAAGEYGGKALDAAGNIPGAGLVKGAAKLAKGVVAQPYNAMTEGPEAKITRAAGGSAGVQERDFQENIPRALKYIVDENKTNPIKTPEDMAEAAHTQKTKLWDEQLAKPHPGETIDGDAIAQKLKDSVNPATRKHDAALAAQIDKWADTFKGPYDLDSAMGAITKFNSDLRNFYKQSPSDQFRMAQADPKLGMLQDAADTLRDAAFAKLSELGEKNIPELRKDYGALNQMQRIFEKRAVVYGRQAPIDLKESLGAIAAFASGHPMAAVVPQLTKYLNSPKYLIQSAIEKAGKAAEAPKSANAQVEQPNRPVNEIRPPGVEAKTPPAKPVAGTSPTGTTATPTEAGKPAQKAPVNPTEATEAPAPGSAIDLETGKAPTEGVRSDFKPYDPENPEGYEKPMPIPSENMPKGMFQRDAHIHEWGHVANAAIEGFGTEGIKSHLNDTLSAKNRPAAAARINFGDTGIKVVDGKIDPETLRENFGKMLATTMGGAAANELHSGIPFEMNQGLHSDVRVIHEMGKSLGLTTEETQGAIQYALDRAKRNLQIPGVGDTLVQNAGVRESGLSETMHASPERTEAFAAEMRRLRDDHYQQQKSGSAGSPTELHDARIAGNDAQIREGNDAGTKGSNEGAGPAGDLETGRAGLKETTTGDDKADEAIRSAGAIPAGKMMNLAMFHDPETGSTLALDHREVTPELVQKHLNESREKFAVKTPEKQAFKGSHYSSVPAEDGQIRGESRGKSKAGSEQARLEHDNRVPGVYAYREGARPEPQIATRANKYGIEGDKAIADISGSEKKLFEDAHAAAVEKYKAAGDNDTVASQKALNDAEAALQKAGFDGYEDKKSKSGSVFLFGDQPVKSGIDLATGKSDEDKGPNLDEFHQAKGLPAPEPTNIPVDKAEGAKIADAYDAMKHDPNDPAVKASYDALKRDTLEQWKALQKQGVKMTVTDDPNHYNDAQEMLRDIHDNKHIAVWSGEGDMPKDHPLREIEPSTGLPYNTLFRGVHDVLGHGVGQNDFSEQGEENAYNLHRQSYSPEAIPALATETKGQANWVFNNKALRESGGEPGEFPTQKAALLPEEFHGADPWAHKAAEQNKDGGFTIDPRNGDVPTKGYQVEATPEGRVDLDHPATPADIQKFYNENREIFAEHPELKVGGYGKELNVSASTDSRANAEALGKKLDQISIWDVKNGKEIPTGGTGKTTSFPDYPLAQRMADLRAKPGIDLETGQTAEAEPETGDTSFNFGANAAELENSKEGSKPDLSSTPDREARPVPYTYDQYFRNSTAPSLILPNGLITPSKFAHSYLAHNAGYIADSGMSNESAISKMLADTGAIRVIHPGPNDGGSIGLQIHRQPSQGQLEILAHDLKVAAKSDVGDGNLVWDLFDNKGKSVSGQGSLGDFRRDIDKFYPDKTVSRPVSNVAGPQQLSAPYDPETSQRVSTRFPTAVNRTEDPMNHDLTLEADKILERPKVAQGLADKLVKQNKSMVFTPEEVAQGPKGIFDSFVRQAKDNIKATYYRAKAAGNHIADRVWYDGAHAFTKTDAEANGISHAQAAGVLATQSPQKDWDANVSLYKRIVDVMKNKGDVEMTPEMEKKGEEFIKQINASNRVKAAKGKKITQPWVERKLLNTFKGKTFNEITSPAAKAAWLRLYDEAHNDRGFDELNADGTVVGPRKTLGGAPEKVAWGGLDSIAKAINIMQDGSLENISQNLGDAHKVRSFYNNIMEPNSPHQDVTSDTHHVGLSLGRPVAGSDPEPVTYVGGDRSRITAVR